MAYQFAGFFASPEVPQPKALPTGAVWREVMSPFTGIGVLLPELFGETPTKCEVETLAQQLGVDAADRWLYLTYDSWGGDIDYVYGLGSRSGVPFGPVEEDESNNVKAAYTSLMVQFGITAHEALEFEPFQRGYWGEG